VSWDCDRSTETRLWNLRKLRGISVTFSSSRSTVKLVMSRLEYFAFGSVIAKDLEYQNMYTLSLCCKVTVALLQSKPVEYPTFLIQLRTSNLPITHTNWIMPYLSANHTKLTSFSSFSVLYYVIKVTVNTSNTPQWRNKTSKLCITLWELGEKIKSHLYNQSLD
jgi:hypothetical protein